MFGLSGAKPIVGAASGAAECPVFFAFRFVGYEFFQHYQKWCPQIVELAPLSGQGMRVGVRGRQVTRERGIDTQSTFEITSFEPPRRLEIKGLSEPYRSEYTFEPDSQTSTLLAFTFELPELELAMRPFRKLIVVALQEGATQTIENLKVLLESECSARAQVS
jgi:Polyketide cyclase / dehydrase and lipid transport